MTTLARPSSPARQERLFTVEEYLRMVDVGILTERDKVELLDGRIVEKMSRNPPHDCSLSALMDILSKLLSGKYVVRCQSALRLPDSVLEPDISIVKGPNSLFRDRHPSGDDALLVIEVSESSLLGDQTEKAGIYARAGIPTYWIVNLVDQRLEVCTDPTGPDHLPMYRSRKHVAITGSVPLSLPGFKRHLISVRQMLMGD